MENINTGIERAIAKAGSASSLAKGIGVPIQSVFFWRKGERRVPADYCPAIERFTAGHVRCEDLRPDIPWGILRSTPTPAQQESAVAHV